MLPTHGLAADGPNCRRLSFLFSARNPLYLCLYLYLIPRSLASFPHRAAGRRSFQSPPSVATASVRFFTWAASVRPLPRVSSPPPPPAHQTRHRTTAADVPQAVPQRNTTLTNQPPTHTRTAHDSFLLPPFVLSALRTLHCHCLSPGVRHYGLLCLATALACQHTVLGVLDSSPAAAHLPLQTQQGTINRATHHVNPPGARPPSAPKEHQQAGKHPSAQPNSPFPLPSSCSSRHPARDLVYKNESLPSHDK